jgi:Sulfotransferase family
MMIDSRGRLRFLGAILSVAGYRAAKPLFVVGTGRCGSSLLVEILGSHRQLVVFPDEANDLWHPDSYPFSRASVRGPSILENPAAYTKNSLARWPAGHGQRIRNVLSAYNLVRGRGRRLVQKSAMITFLVPRILDLFPDARLCHIYRSGPPVVESLVKKDWSKYADRFANRDEFRLACAGYWNDCVLEIERQDTRLHLGAKGLLLELSYEALCADPRQAYARLASFLSIDPEAFEFDPTRIRSQNDKVGDYSLDSAWRAPLRLMAEGMRLKGFSLTE